MSTSYLGRALYRSERYTMLRQMEDYLRPLAYRFDAIAFRGMSGAMVAPCIADKLDKKLMMVRKPDDGSAHSSMRVEGEGSNRYIIIDDFVSSGRTVREIVSLLKDTGFATAPPVACVCYQSADWHEPFVKLDDGTMVEVWRAGKWTD